jgi:cytochrome P450
MSQRRDNAMQSDATTPSEAARPSPPRLAAQLPGPRGIPFFGNALQVDPAHFHLQLEQWARDFGPFYQMRLVKRRIVVVGDHEVVAAVLRDRPDGFRRTSRLDDIAREMGMPPFVFNANGEVWKRQRRMVMAGFDPGHVNGYFPALLTVAQRLAGRWARAAQQGHSIDLQADLMRYTVDAIAGLAFGADVNTLESDGDVIQQHLDKLFPALFKRMLSPLPTWRWLRGPAHRRLEHSLAEVKRAVAGFIAQARARLHADPALREHPRNLLEAMLVAAEQEGSGIDDAQVAGNVLGMLLAGEDTTANSIAWMIHLLWRHPAALARATDEVRRVTGRFDAPTLDQIAQLDYLEACAHETMRLKPVAPILPLQALRDVTLGDVRVPAGTIVISLMRRDSVSESHLLNAQGFEPERWLANGSPTAQASAARRTSMPFGAGPRICPGRYLALLEMKVAMAVLLARFDIESVDTPDGQEARERMSFTMTPVGLRMRLRERAPAPARGIESGSKASSRVE